MHSSFALPPAGTYHCYAQLRLPTVGSLYGTHAFVARNGAELISTDTASVCACVACVRACVRLMARTWCTHEMRAFHGALVGMAGSAAVACTA